MSLYSWVRRDGLLHFLASAVIVFTLSIAFPWWAGATISLVAGIVKELWDINHDGVPSWHDIICDVAGIIFASVLCAL